jgi:hypothetical protein
MPPSTTVVSSMTPTRAARGTRRVPVSASRSLTVAASLGWARRMHSVGQTMVPAGERPPNGSHSGAHVRLLYLLPQCRRHSCSQARLNASGPKEGLGTHVSREYTKGRAQQRKKGKLSHEFQ